ncbi:hypothetical protein StrepF001_15015 [Streptomyces sp. F001]|uniref:hypothetical protein n=1 Tax=Streptomyces sp. F001 TaxID=1510026 RepID=UPI00101E553C|nr:hypothetical protein [Streptomyces sp. F001]RZB18388.1 hypothetical protein StrepF001_15015 [Streptomyces sp. F001]
MSRPGSTGLRFGMFAVCITRDPDAELNKGKAKPLYDLLVSFADVSSRDTGQGYPYRSVLADCLDCSKQTVDRAAAYLEKEIGLIRIVRRKVEGKEDENDANLYMIFDAWLIHGVPPPGDTPPQLVARYGRTIPGFDVAAWMQEHAPAFDLAGWQAAYDEKVRVQQAKREEQRRKERARRKKSKTEGGVTGDATPENSANEGGDVMGDATGGVTGDVSGDVMGDALSKAGVQEPSFETDDAPSARSARGVRSTSTSGSGAREAASGSAAAGKAGTSTGKSKASGVPVQRDGEAGKPTREQAAAVRAVEVLLPPLLVRELPYGHIPTRNRAAVLEALESRTLEQLRERIARRWVAYGYEPAIHDGELRSAIGAALELIIPSRYCPDPACEDGTLIDTGADCRACMERKAKRLADRLAGNTPPASKGRAAAPTCDVCERPFPGEIPADLLCKPCRAEIERANSRFASGPAADETDRQEREETDRREAEELEHEAQRRRARRATEAAGATAPAVEDIDPADAQAAAEEDARIRAELLAAHPWMADYAQEPAAPQGPAPF